MARRRHKAMLITVIAAVLAQAGAAFAQAQPVNVALVPEQNVFLQIKRFRPLQDYLTAATGDEYRFTVMSSYYDAFMALSNGKAQAALLGSLATLLAIELEEGEVLGRPLWKNGASTYRALIIARKDSGIRSVANLKGKRYAFVNPLSTAGWLFERWLFAQQGLGTPGRHLGMTIIAGSHDVVVEAVYRGHVDAGGCKDMVFDRKLLEYPDLAEKVSVIARSQALPDSNLVLSPSMPDGPRERLREKLFTMHSRQDGQRALEEMGILRFIPGAQGDFSYLQGMLRALGFEPGRYTDLPLAAP